MFALPAGGERSGAGQVAALPDRPRGDLAARHRPVLPQPPPCQLPRPQEADRGHGQQQRGRPPEVDRGRGQQQRRGQSAASPGQTQPRAILVQFLCVLRDKRRYVWQQWKWGQTFIVPVIVVLFLFVVIVVVVLQSDELAGPDSDRQQQSTEWARGGGGRVQCPRAARQWSQPRRATRHRPRGGAWPRAGQWGPRGPRGGVRLWPGDGQMSDHLVQHTRPSTRLPRHSQAQVGNIVFLTLTFKNALVFRFPVQIIWCRLPQPVGTYYIVLTLKNNEENRQKGFVPILS